MLGKRQRSYMRRTTSMAEVAAAAKQGRSQGRATRGASPYLPFSSVDAAGTGVGGAGLAPAMNWGDFAAVETAPFLKNCGLCKGRLGPGRDTFMYRGEVAFCSLECREQQINLDERKEKNCSLTSIKEAPPVSGAGSSDQSGNGETVAAA